AGSGVPASRREAVVEGLRAAAADAKRQPQLMILAEDGYDPDLIDAFDEVSQKSSIPWMLVRAGDPMEGWVGPIFAPGETASWRSLQAWYKANLSHYEEYTAFDKYVRASGAPAAVCGTLTPVIELLSGIAATEIVSYLSGV